MLSFSVRRAWRKWLKWFCICFSKCVQREMRPCCCFLVQSHSPPWVHLENFYCCSKPEYRPLFLSKFRSKPQTIVGTISIFPRGLPTIGFRGDQWIYSIFFTNLGKRDTAVNKDILGFWDKHLKKGVCDDPTCYITLLFQTSNGIFETQDSSRT